MPSEQTPATRAYFVKKDRLIYARFTDEAPAGRSVEFAGPPSRAVSPTARQKGPWKASWSWVMVVASYDENDDLHDVEVIGVPPRRPPSKPEDWPQPR
jgi:hypothetical protein